MKYREFLDQHHLVCIKRDEARWWKEWELSKGKMALLSELDALRLRVEELEERNAMAMAVWARHSDKTIDLLRDMCSSFIHYETLTSDGDRIEIRWKERRYRRFEQELNAANKFLKGKS